MDWLISVNAFPLHDSRRVLKLRMASLMITISGHSVVAVPLGTEGRRSGWQGRKMCGFGRTGVRELTRDLATLPQR